MPTATLNGFQRLQRMDYPEQKVACYRVKIHRQGVEFMEYFAFKNYPSEAAALAAAKEYWQEVREAFPRLTQKQNAEVERRKTRSGVIGVARVIGKTKGHEYEYWRATFTDRRGARRIKQFSINKYGEAEAKKRAIKARKDGLTELDK